MITRLRGTDYLRYLGHRTLVQPIEIEHFSKAKEALNQQLRGGQNRVIVNF